MKSNEPELPEFVEAAAADTLPPETVRSLELVDFFELVVVSRERVAVVVIAVGPVDVAAPAFNPAVNVEMMVLPLASIVVIA